LLVLKEEANWPLGPQNATKSVREQDKEPLGHLAVCLGSPIARWTKTKDQRTQKKGMDLTDEDWLEMKWPLLPFRCLVGCAVAPLLGMCAKLPLWQLRGISCHNGNLAYLFI
jgi:hypothetical protein